jgi:hypothetical protein
VQFEHDYNEIAEPFVDVGARVGGDERGIPPRGQGVRFASRADRRAAASSGGSRPIREHDDGWTEAPAPRCSRDTTRLRGFVATCTALS